MQRFSSALVVCRLCCLKLTQGIVSLMNEIITKSPECTWLHIKFIIKDSFSLEAQIFHHKKIYEIARTTSSFISTCFIM